MAINDENDGYGEIVHAAIDAADGDPDRAADLLLNDANRALVQVRNFRGHLQAEILDHWGTAIDGLDLLISLVDDVTDVWDETFDEKDYGAARYRTHGAWILTLGALSCAHDISALIANGCGSGALARWRTIHELNVVANILREADEGVAEAYLDRERYRAADAAIRVHRAWKDGYVDEDVPRETVDEAKEALRALEQNYGQVFAGNYGWAHALLYESSSAYRGRYDLGEKPNGPGFSELQSVAELRMYGSDYALASTAIHASPGVAALYVNQFGGVGPSYEGLGFPGYGAAAALGEISFWLLAGCPESPDEDLTSWASLLWSLAVRVSEAFPAAEERLRARAEGPGDSVDP